MTNIEAQNAFSRIARVFNTFNPISQTISIKFWGKYFNSQSSISGVESFTAKALTSVSTTYSDEMDSLIVRGIDADGEAFRIEVSRTNNDFSSMIMRMVNNQIVLREENSIYSIYATELFTF